MMLRKMCLKYKQLPPSHAVADELRWVEGYPWGGGGNADVWRGVYRGSRVAIKVLRVNLKDFDILEKVRSSVFIPSNENPTRIRDRDSVAKWSCGSSSNTRTCCSWWGRKKHRQPC